jgi:hypothetical protein
MEAVRRGHLDIDCRGIPCARQREISMLLQLAPTRASDAH